ncbi:MAG TPA: hypothetical protein VHR47_11410, partial [Bacillota bacterium]|nr:hypothetical protein [Bacillota bacterium]
IISKYLDLGEKSSVLLGSYAMVENLASESATIVAYTTEQVNIHQTNQEKAEVLLTTMPEWLTAPCQECRKSISWKRYDMEVPAGCDLYISGLGWFAVRKADAHLRVQVPQGVEVGLRKPTLFGGKGSSKL